MPSKNDSRDLDLSRFPAAAVTSDTTQLCLSCLFKLFTKQMNLAPRTAYSEIKRYVFSVPELTGKELARPFFRNAEKNPRCPSCNAARRSHARLDIYRIEGGKQTDAARRALVKSLPKMAENFQIIEVKTTRRAAFYEWLDALGHTLDFADDSWLISTTRALLERREPKLDGAEIFSGVRAVRRSQRLTEGWERDGARLFLSPPLYGETLLVQYLVSRAQTHGGLTLDGRLTLSELLRRLRHAGLFAAPESAGADQFELLEQAINKLAGGGDETLKYYYVIDRRDFLDKVKSVYSSFAT